MPALTPKQLGKIEYKFQLSPQRPYSIAVLRMFTLQLLERTEGSETDSTKLPPSAQQTALTIVTARNYPGKPLELSRLSPSTHPNASMKQY